MHLILLRHGQSVWNKENRFTGWQDVPLSNKGRQEAEQAAQSLKKNDIEFSHSFCSSLKRSQETLEIILKSLNLNLKIKPHWELNERHYGSLQGQNKEEAEKKFGKDQVFKWRRSFLERPPDCLEAQNFDLKKFPGLKQIPKAESLKDTYERVIPFFKSHIKELLKKESVLIVAHGNSLRALIKYIESISEQDISKIELATGTPLVYILNKNLKFLEKKLLLK